ncbi:MAG: tRNA epoxyqueuosine(34) reductase QueG [Burkholderiaceae bacterium]
MPQAVAEQLQALQVYGIESNRLAVNNHGVSNLNPHPTVSSPATSLLQAVRDQALALGFADLRVVSLQEEVLAPSVAQMQAWLEQGYAGEMDYLSKHLALRADPSGLLPGAQTALVVCMNYLQDADWQANEANAIDDPSRAVVSVYARGRDYHKVLRSALAKLGDAVSLVLGPMGHRACVDSAPVMEVSLAQAAGLGWRGKHTLLLHRERGSMFFLGVLLTDLTMAQWQANAPHQNGSPDAPSGVSPLASSSVQDGAHCGSCTACLSACPTQAFVGPYQLDARRCISYLTIEHSGDIDEALRPLIGNRLYGCDDCQRACPWNKYAQLAAHPDFQVRHGLDQTQLLDLLAWRGADFERVFQGSAVLRIGYGRWLRNLTVVAGNALRSPTAEQSLGDQLGQSCLLSQRVMHAATRSQQSNRLR